ncbi:hypothetical protein BV22DRAFT_1094102 [Leucogyrophana mollusca]|uniref:Uncharacterized protein n=1 Tax=Leucogyrophana mollusca TaxID=85980 RepID=A0ACB8BAA0_9AGAM|nr:hypothetical protein BV22DRAFT_1094102 [Leucogyrophana mollusca]
MFGESDSESPRVPSPWDSLTSVPPTPPRQAEVLKRGIPRLVPEAEEGNVEYKLQLLSPSPARFTRLVTQLKWRLLEGGGQAYYELGVADSGTLIGLPRRELEESLETLEMMAGEIGASVIVVKEIEVPPELSDLAESQIDRWDCTKRRRREILSITPDDVSSTDLETEFSTATDFTDVEEGVPVSVESVYYPFHLRHCATVESAPCDSTLAVFTMDPDSDTADHADSELAHGSTTFSVDLEIASVYKPRPMRKRAHLASSLGPAQTHSDKRGSHLKGKKPQRHPPNQAHSQPHDVPQSPDEPNADQSETAPIKQVKAQQRRLARDRRRDFKRNTLLTHVATNRSIVLNGESKDAAPSTLAITAVPDSLVSGLESLHVTVEPTSFEDAAPALDSGLLVHPEGAEPAEGTKPSAAVTAEPRLIVEALVVRKMSLEEAFLDFGGFSLR